MLHLDDTVAAVATPPGEGGIGIVRISGPSAFAIAERIWQPASRRTVDASRLPTHTIHYGRVVDPASSEAVDDALLLTFRRPHSYTGEDVIELSCHGGPVTLGRVLALALREGARAAEPGEFTRRAFLNGQMDLAQAEAVCDLIRAKTEAAQRLALRQREGGLSREVARLRDELVGALAAVEVTIDFSDEVGELNYPAVRERIAEIRTDMDRLIATVGEGRLYREGVRLAIVGRPNVGKSSLLNAILREDRAIVTPIPGTTRDVIEESANLRGIPLVAIDTAGLRETEDVVERIGVERAHAAAESASVILFALDGTTGWTPADAAIGEHIAGRRVVWAINKADLIPANEMEALGESVRERSGDAPVVVLSALTGEGIDRLEDALAAVVLGGRAEESAVVVSSVRHLDALESARVSLVHADETAAQGLPPDFISIDLRGALDSLGRITGETASEEIIERIFQDFCVGK